MLITYIVMRYRCSKKKKEKFNFKFIISIILGVSEQCKHDQIEKDVTFHMMYGIPLTPSYLRMYAPECSAPPRDPLAIPEM